MKKNEKTNTKIAIEILDEIQLKLMRTATLEDKTHHHRNIETRDIVKSIEWAKKLLSMNEDFGDLPF